MEDINIIKSLLIDLCSEDKSSILKEKFLEDIDLITDLEFDSLQFVSLFINIEQAYNIELSSEVYNFENTRKLGTLIKYIDVGTEKRDE